MSDHYNIITVFEAVIIKSKCWNKNYYFNALNYNWDSMYYIKSLLYWKESNPRECMYWVLICRRDLLGKTLVKNKEERRQKWERGAFRLWSKSDVYEKREGKKETSGGRTSDWIAALRNLWLGCSRPYNTSQALWVKIWEVWKFCWSVKVSYNFANL